MRLYIDATSEENIQMFTLLRNIVYQNIEWYDSLCENCLYKTKTLDQNVNLHIVCL